MLQWLDGQWAGDGLQVSIQLVHQRSTLELMSGFTWLVVRVVGMVLSSWIWFALPGWWMHVFFPILPLHG